MGKTVQVDDNVLLVRCGIGRARAERAARALLEAGADALISWGTAAAVSPDLSHGDLVLPREVLTRDGRRFSVDDSWCDRLEKILEPHGGCHAGTVAEADGVLANADDKLRLHNLSGALIADMESAAIAKRVIWPGAGCWLCARSRIGWWPEFRRARWRRWMRTVTSMLPVVWGSCCSRPAICRRCYVWRGGFVTPVRR